MSSPSSKEEEHSSGSDELRTKTAMIKNLEAAMQALDVRVSPPVMAKNVEPGSLGQQMTVQTNVFGLSVNKPQVVYQYDVTLHSELPNGKVVEFSKKARGDHLSLDRRAKCVALVKIFLAENAALVGDQYSNWYDGQSILYSLKNIFAENDEKTVKIFSIEGAKTGNPELADLLCILTLKKTDKKINFCQEEICNRGAVADLRQADHSLVQFAEVVLNQYAIMTPARHSVYENGKTYMVEPKQEGFNERDCPEVGDGKRLMVGTQKSVRHIEGPQGRNTSNPSLVIDAKKAAFHEPVVVVQKAQKTTKEMLDKPVSPRGLERLNSTMRGLTVYTEYTGKVRTFEITSISSLTALTAVFERQDKKITVADYFQEKYNIKLQFPHAPLLIAKIKGVSNQYPMELCTVVPMQRVTVPQQTPEESQQTTKNCAIVPSQRQTNIMKGATALELLNQANPYISNSGLKVYPNPLQVPGRVLPGPHIKFGGAETLAERGKWRSPKGRFLRPATCNMWAIYCVSDGRPSKFALNESTLGQFAQLFYKECGNRGISMKGPVEMKFLAESEVREKLKTAASHNCQFVFFITSDSITSLHKNMKLWERESQIVTQDMKMSNAYKVVAERKMLTLENVIMKTNMKLGGLNYSINLSKIGPAAAKWLHPGRLVLGVGLSHPPPSAVIEMQKGGSLGPTVLGYSANFKSDPYDYVGDYIYQETRREEASPSIGAVVEVVIERFKESHDGRTPSELIIYRSGLADGSFALIISHEIPILRARLKKLGASDCRIVFICVQKEHNVRLMLDRIDPRGKPTEQNICSGVVVDTQLTHPAFREFYLNSHTTIQGSARSPRYSVLVDECQLSSDEIEGMTYALAHNHQIVSLATSMPAPLYIANRYAERGRNTLAAHTAREESSSTSSDSSSSDFHRLTEQLGFAGTRLAQFRVNA